MRRIGISGSILCVVFLGLYALVFPRQFLMRGDDFGYFDAVVRTLWAGSIQGADWPAPANFAFTGICAMAYAVTKNFFLSTFGVVGFFFLGSAVLLVGLLQARGFRASDALVLALMLVAHPIALDPGFDFVGVSAYFFFFFASLFFWPRSRWAFALCVVTAFSIRQSALVLCALPIFQGVAPLLRREKMRSGEAALGVGLFLGLLWLNTVFPKGYNASLYASTTTVLRSVSATNAAAVLGQTVATLIPWIFLMQLVAGRVTAPGFAQRARAAVLPAVGICLGVFLLNGMSFESIFLSGCSPLAGLHIEKSRFALVPLGLLLLLDYRAFSWNEYVFAAVGSLLLVALKGINCPYYLVDMLVLLMLGLRPIFSQPSKVEAEPVRWPAFYGILTLMVISFGALDRDIQRSTAAYHGYERALRRGLLDITEGSWMTRGMIGWKLHGYYVHQDKRPKPALPCQHCALSYIKTDASSFRIHREDEPVPVALPGETEVGSSEFRSEGYRWRFLLLRTGKDSGTSLNYTDHLKLVPLDRASYRERCAPLSNREWDFLIAARDYVCPV